MSASTSSPAIAPKTDAANVSRGAKWVVLFRLTGAALAFGSNIVIAKLVPPEVLGQYLLCSTIIIFGTFANRFGLDRVVVRYLAEAIALHDEARVKRTLQVAGQLFLVASLLVAVGLPTLMIWLGPQLFGNGNSAPVHWLLVGTIVATTSLMLAAEGLRGCHRLFESSLFSAEQSGPALAAMVLLLAIVGTWLWTPTLEVLLVCMLLAALLLLVPAAWALQRAVKSQLHSFDPRPLPGATSEPLAVRVATDQVASSSPMAKGVLSTGVATPATIGSAPGTVESPPATEVHQPRLDHLTLKAVLAVSLPILAAQLLGVASVFGDLWITSALGSADEKAYAGAAKRLALLLQMPGYMVTSTLSAAIPALYTQKRIEELQRLISTAATAGGLACGSACLVMLIFPRLILSTIFRPYFADAATFLQIMTVTQIAISLIGSPEIILLMCGSQRLNLWVSLFFAAALFTTGPLVLVQWGATTLMMWSGTLFVGRALTLWFAAYRLHGLQSNVTPEAFLRVADGLRRRLPRLGAR